VVIEEKRLQRGLAIWKAGQVSPNGAQGQYYVASQSRSIRYLVATPWAACGAKCQCEDFEKGHICKHIIAAGAAEAHRKIARRQANGETLASIEFDVAAIGLAGIPNEVELGWELYLRTVQAIRGEGR
jgi:uncharacterized Zn finger protein